MDTHPSESPRSPCVSSTKDAELTGEGGPESQPQQHGLRSESLGEAGTSTTFEVAIEKTDKGFGIFFTKQEREGELNPSHHLVVDGFVEDASEMDGDPLSKKEALQKVLRVGDILIGINNTDCQQMDPMEIIGLLRSAPLGDNAFQFSRLSGKLTSGCEFILKKETASSITQSFMGALLKVKTKIKEGIEGDEEQLLREQREQELFEKTWLEEFDRLKQEYETKWETCTYTADEFCGLLYHSGDPQQKEYLSREYPVLMDAWKHANLSAPSLRIRPDWPTPKTSYSEPITYHHQLSPANDDERVEPSATRHIDFSPSLHKVLGSLRKEFAWHRGDVLAFGTKLETSKIYSCMELLEALQARSAHFERNFQSKDYPRLSKAICRALLQEAQRFAKAEEDMSEKCMDQLKVNNAA